MMHMLFDMCVRNKKGQDMFKLLTSHAKHKHISAWLLFFHPFFLCQSFKKQAPVITAATTTEAGSTERAASAVDMEWLI
jgi:hypothetical protein